MKHQPKRYRKFLLPAILVILIGGLAATALAYHYHNSNKKPATAVSVRPQNSIDYTPATSSDNTANENRKNSGSTAPTLNSSGTSSTSGSTAPSPAPAFSATITNASANTTIKSVHVGTLVSGVTSGSCTLTATQSGQSSVVKSSSVQLDINYYDCGVFNIPFTDFPHSGDWKFTLTVKNGTDQATNIWANPVTIPSS